MANSDRFDELFRRAFQRVRVPVPPELDWRALAKASARGRGASAALAGRIWGLSLAAGVAAVATLLLYSGSPDPRTIRPSPLRVPELVAREHPADGAHALSDPANVDTRASAPLTSPDASGASVVSNVTVAATQRDGGRSTGTIGTTAPHRTVGGSIVVDDDHARKGSSMELIMPQTGSTVEAMRDDERVPLLDPIMITGAQAQGSPLSWTPGASPSPTIARWSVSPWVSFDQTTFSDDRASSSALNDLQLDPGFTGTFGARINYAFDERLSVYTGAQLAWKGALKGTISTSTSQYATYDLSGRYLEIPLGIRFTAPKERWSLYARAGAALQLNMRPGDDHVVVYDLVAKEARTMRLASNSVGVAGELAAGLEFRVKRGLSMFIEPVFRAGLTPIMQHPSFTGLPLNPREHTLGLATGITYQFGSK